MSSSHQEPKRSRNESFSDSEHPGTLSSFTGEERLGVQKKLNKRLGPEFLSYRAGGGGGNKIPYIEGWRAINLANDTFGFDGWSSSVVSVTVDYLDDLGDTRCNCGVSAVVRIQVKNGAQHEDVGYGVSENQKGKGAALEKAKKEAVTDATKRALRLFGSSLGNCVYDKEYLKFMRGFANEQHVEKYNLSEFRRENSMKAECLLNGNPQKNDISTINNNLPPVQQQRPQQQTAPPPAAASSVKVESNVSALRQQPQKATATNPIQQAYPVSAKSTAAVVVPISRALKRSASHPSDTIMPVSDPTDYDDDLFLAIDNVELDLNANNYVDSLGND